MVIMEEAWTCCINYVICG